MANKKTPKVKGEGTKAKLGSRAWKNLSATERSRRGRGEYRDGKWGEETLPERDDRKNYFHKGQRS